MEERDIYIVIQTNDYLESKGYLKGDIIFITDKQLINTNGLHTRLFTINLASLQGNPGRSGNFLLEQAGLLEQTLLKLRDELLENLYNYQIIRHNGLTNSYVIDLSNSERPSYYLPSIRSIIADAGIRVVEQSTIAIPTSSLRFNVNESSKKDEINKNITDELLISLFKYIPIKYHYYNAFYDTKTNKIVYWDGGKVKVIFKKLDNIAELFSIFVLSKYCKFKVKSYEKSAKLFQNTNFKKCLVGNSYTVEKISLQTEVKRSKDLQNTLYVVTQGGKSRFLLEDIEIIYPNISGYNIAKDRTISKGSTVRVINDKHMSYIKKNDIVKVESIRKVGDKKYAAIKVNNNIVYERLNKFKKIC